MTSTGRPSCAGEGAPGVGAGAESRRWEWIYDQPPLVRVGVLWTTMLAVLFISFGLHLWAGSGYDQPPTTAPETVSVLRLMALAWTVNLANAALIGVASTLFRFGPINVGTAYLTVQILLIGRIAGLNTFTYPMPSVADGLVQFLQVGLWEVTAYIIVAAVTMTKARWIADRLGAAQWRQRRRWRQLAWTSGERWLLAAAVTLILGAGAIEAITLAGW